MAESRFAKIRGLIRDIRGHFPCQSFMDYSSIGTTVNSKCGVVLAAMTGDGTSKSKSRSFGGHECFCGLMKCYFRACTTSWNAQINDEKLVFGDQRLVGSRALRVEIMNCLKIQAFRAVLQTLGVLASVRHLISRRPTTKPSLPCFPSKILVVTI